MNVLVGDLEEGIQPLWLCRGFHPRLTKPPYYTVRPVLRMTGRAGHHHLGRVRGLPVMASWSLLTKTRTPEGMHAT